jgi:hypothetical protein
VSIEQPEHALHVCGDGTQDLLDEDSAKPTVPGATPVVPICQFSQATLHFRMFAFDRGIFLG